MINAGYVRQSDFKALLDRFQDFLIPIAADEGDTQTLGSESSSTTNAVQVAVCICGKVIIDGEVDALNIDTPTENIGGDADTLVEFFEFFVPLDANTGIRLRRSYEFVI